MVLPFCLSGFAACALVFVRDAALQCGAFVRRFAETVNGLGMGNSFSRKPKFQVV